MAKQTTADIAWKGLMGGVSEIFSSEGTFTLGDLYSISGFKPENIGKIVLVRKRGNVSEVIPGYEVILGDEANGSISENLKVKTFTAITGDIVDDKKSKAQWN